MWETILIEGVLHRRSHSIPLTLYYNGMKRMARDGRVDGERWAHGDSEPNKHKSSTKDKVLPKTLKVMTIG